ncbi:peptidase M48 [Sphingomonas ginkgonis]|uniref:Peptidase M48 n=1 Tax=Sphingomonas ginkgonis TaxID=2315330 RepID=A0A3S0EP33_9SPHN|nr:M48 family metalloprotease [Sphingomonas ginkgonis]RST31918.1 peptidase M48 [Sphingomonas ginkgonis]
MTRHPLLSRAALGLALLFAAAQPAAAQSILRDSETEALFADATKPLVQAAGLNPRNVNVALINDPEINAFVATGQTVYIQTGLLEAADNANQLQGVIAHELGHVTAGDSIRAGEGMKQATGISILSLVLGAAAMAAGGGEAAMGVMAAGQQAALGNLLAFTRVQETSADLAGSRFLSGAGISGKGSIAFFKKLQNQEYRLAIPQDDAYARTHPLSSDRIQTLQAIYQKDPAWNRSTDPVLEARFQRVKAKLIGYLDPQRATQLYPETDQSVPAHYARAYAYHQGAYLDKAVAEADALLRTAPNDPYFNELKGQILLESGKPKEALEPLRLAVRNAPDKPMIAVMLGHALVETNDAKNMTEAKSVLKAAVNRDNDNPFAWYQMGVIYEHEGDEARASLATAERSNLEGDAKLALTSARRAMAGLPQGTPDYLRAQDIAMVSESAAKKGKKGR